MDVFDSTESVCNYVIVFLLKATCKPINVAHNNAAS